MSLPFARPLSVTPKEDDTEWRSPHWITDKECTYLALAIILELQAKGFQRVKKASGHTAYSGS